MFIYDLDLVPDPEKENMKMNAMNVIPLSHQNRVLPSSSSSLVIRSGLKHLLLVFRSRIIIKSSSAFYS